jgi:hypothetical protein
MIYLSFNKLIIILNVSGLNILVKGQRLEEKMGNVYDPTSYCPQETHFK